ncbi:cupin domain-containing protein [Vibrio sp. JC009]|uniref:cupin domain-containing protein n=1 Tax=Vibrio sp. JC009 TaxID=2912314 RepID=UPI0023AFBB90|nr:cupin domain-containing protein [Vibrio sp. JC009]WED23927.1 cupin domain-containing protein [Vibrio sp. JC009]
MSEQLIKNIEHSAVHNLESLIDYKPGKVASLTLSQKKSVGMTLFAIDKGEGLNTHSAPGDAFAQILEGTVEITIADEKYTLTGGQSVVMPANIPHALKAVEPFKFLLVLIKPEPKPKPQAQSSK